MGLRLRKSFRIGPGLRLNLSKTGVSLGFGMPGLNYNVHTSGRRKLSIGLPGTGIGFVSTSSNRGVSGRNRGSKASPEQSGAFDPITQFILGTSKFEKAFANGVSALFAVDFELASAHFVEAAAMDSDSKTVADEFMAGLCQLFCRRLPEAALYLERVMASELFLPDDLMAKYKLNREIQIPISNGIHASVPMGTVAAAMLLVEIYQDQGDLKKSMELLEQLHDLAPSSAATLSLCDLLHEQKDWTNLEVASRDIENADDVSMAIRIFHAKALIRLDRHEQARIHLTETLRYRARNSTLLVEARYLRGCLWMREKENDKARKDLLWVQTQNAEFRNTATLLQKLAKD